MEYFAGIDVSLELSSVCVVDAQGKIVKEAKVASEPEALVAFFAAFGFAVKQIGLEAGPLSQWLYAGLKQAGLETVPSGSRQIDGIAGGACAAGCAQAASWAVDRRGIEHSGDPARLWPEGRSGDTQEF